MRSCGLLFSWMRSLISDCFATLPFSTVPSQVFWQECFVETPESVWVPFSLLGLLELCQLAHLQYWVVSFTHPRLAPKFFAIMNCLPYPSPPPPPPPPHYPPPPHPPRPVYLFMPGCACVSGAMSGAIMSASYNWPLPLLVLNRDRQTETETGRRREKESLCVRK